MASNTVDLFVRLRDVAQAQAGLKSLSNEVVKAKQEQKRASLENQVLANREKLQVQEMRVEMAKRQAIIRGSQSDIARSIQAQNSFNQALRQQNVLRQRLANFDSEMTQTGSTGWDSLRKILQGNTSQLGVFGNLADDVFANGATAALGMGAAVGGITLAIGVATAAFTELNRQFSESSKRATERIFSANSIVNAIPGIDSATAKKYIDISNRTISSEGGGLVDVASAQMFNSQFLDDYLRTSKQLGLTMEQAAKASALFARDLAGVQKYTGVNESELRSAVIGAIGGTYSTREFLKLDVINESGAGKAFERVMSTIGKGRDLAQLSEAERIQVIQKTIAQVYSPQAQAEVAGTSAGMMAKFTDSLFNLDTGIFSIERQLSSGGSVFDQMNETVKLVFGTDGTLSELAKVFGGTGDIMEDLKSIIVSTNELLKGFNQFLKMFEPTAQEKAGNDFYKRERQKQSEAFQKVYGREENFLDSIAGSFITRLKTEALRPLWVPQTQSNYQGLLQSFKPAYSGFSSAYSTEFRNKPPGTSIGLLYNTGEDILPPGMLQSFLQGAYSQGSRQTQSPIITIAEGAIQVTALPGQDPLEIANYTIDLLMNRLREELAT